MINTHKARGINIYCKLKTGELEKEISPTVKSISPGKTEKVRTKFNSIVYLSECKDLTDHNTAAQITKTINEELTKGEYLYSFLIPEPIKGNAIEAIDAIVADDRFSRYMIYKDKTKDELNPVRIDLYKLDNIP